MKRTFIGIKIITDNSILRLLYDLKKNLPYPQLFWMDPENLHLTLRFLGNTEESQLVEIANKLDLSIPRFNVFNLEIKGLGIFGSSYHPRILWADIKCPPQIFQMVEIIEDVVSSSGFERETKPYSPHLSLCRIKNLKEIDSLNDLIGKYKNTVISRQEVKQIILYESILRSSGSIYNPLKTFFLGNADWK